MSEKFTTLPAAATGQNTDIHCVVQGGVSSQQTTAQLYAGILANNTSSNPTYGIVTANTSIKLKESGVGTDTITFQSPVLGSSYTLTFPTTDGNSGEALLTDGNGVLSWGVSATGNVVGPASSTDLAVVRFDGITGELLKNGVVIISDTGDISGAITAKIGTGLTASGTYTLATGSGGIASGNQSAVIGGTGGTAAGVGSVVLGGLSLTANGDRTVAVGGNGNNLTNDATDSVIVGGTSNTIDNALRGAILGGTSNSVGANYGVCLGGSTNEANGISAIAAGNRAKAANNNTFVWADGTAADFTSTATDSFLIRASNGVGIGTASPSASALLDVQSTTKGVRDPNMTVAQMNAIAAPAAGLRVFATDTSQFMGYNGSAWIVLG